MMLGLSEGLNSADTLRLKCKNGGTLQPWLFLTKAQLIMIQAFGSSFIQLVESWLNGLFHYACSFYSYCKTFNGQSQPQAASK